MTKELFDAVVGTPPPSTVDIPAIIRRRRRMRAARRMGIVVLAPVAVAGVLTATVLATSGDGTPVPGYTVQPAPTTVPSPVLTAQQLRAALAEAVAAVVPDARWLPDGQPPMLEPPAPVYASAVLPCDTGGCREAEPTDAPIINVAFSGEADLERAGSTGLVGVVVYTSRTWLDCDSSPFLHSCTVGSSPHGYAMAIRAYKTFDPPNGTAGPNPVTTRAVAIELPDRRVLALTFYGVKDPTVSPDRVLTETELVAIADEVVHRVTG